MKKIIFSIILLLAFAPAFAFAQTPATITINPNLPGVYNVSTVGPCGWIVDFYNFALIIAGILAFGAVVFGGVKYATSAGNASSQSEGRAWIWSALLGLLLLGAAYLILYTVNPNLTKCQLASLSGVAASTGSTSGGATTNGSGGASSVGSTGAGSSGNTGSSSSGGTPSNGTCVAPTDGPCSMTQIQGTCLGGDAQQAAGICKRESGGNTTAQGDQCADGNYASIGLFQINISSARITNSNGQTLNCPAAFSSAFTATNHTCTVINQSLYQQCVTAMENPSTNIANTCADSSNGTNWKYWSTSGSSCAINGSN